MLPRYHAFSDSDVMVKTVLAWISQCFGDTKVVEQTPTIFVYGSGLPLYRPFLPLNLMLLKNSFAPLFRKQFCFQHNFWGEIDEPFYQHSLQ